MLRQQFAGYSVIPLTAYGMPEIENEIDVRPLISFENPEWYGVGIDCIEPEVESLWLPEKISLKLRTSGIQDRADLADLSFENIVSRASLSTEEAEQLQAWSRGEIILEIKDEELLKKLQNIKHKSLFRFSEDGCRTKREKIARFKELYQAQLSDLQKLATRSNDAAAAITYGRLCAYGVTKGEEEEYYELALAAGSAQAANDLAVLLHRKNPFPDTRMRVMQLYQAAQEFGVPEATYNLAVANLHFCDDQTEAERLLRQAVSLGIDQAQEVLDNVSSYSAPHQMAHELMSELTETFRQLSPAPCKKAAALIADLNNIQREHDRPPIEFFRRQCLRRMLLLVERKRRFIEPGDILAIRGSRVVVDSFIPPKIAALPDLIQVPLSLFVENSSTWFVHKEPKPQKGKSGHIVIDARFYEKKEELRYLNCVNVWISLSDFLNRHLGDGIYLRFCEEFKKITLSTTPLPQEKTILLTVQDRINTAIFSKTNAFEVKIKKRSLSILKKIGNFINFRS